MALILLRDLPGIEVLEYRIEEYGWTREVEDAIHELSEELFGIAEWDIPDEWDDDEYYPAFKMMRDESDAYWAARGWDVTDGKGKQLQVMECLLRPLTCVVEKLHPDARYTGDTTAVWAAQLEAAAKRFRPSR